jgi:hypothetical protein
MNNECRRTDFFTKSAPQHAKRIALAVDDAILKKEISRERE